MRSYYINDRRHSNARDPTHWIDDYDFGLAAAVRGAHNAHAKTHIINMSLRGLGLVNLMEPFLEPLAARDFQCHEHIEIYWTRRRSPFNALALGFINRIAQPRRRRIKNIRVTHLNFVLSAPDAI